MSKRGSQGYRIAAEYFSGENPLSIQGDLVVHPALLVFYFRDAGGLQQLRIPYRQVRRLEPCGNGYRLEFSYPFKAPPGLISFPLSPGRIDPFTPFPAAKGGHPLHLEAVKDIKQIYKGVQRYRRAAGTIILGGSFFLRFLYLPLFSQLLLAGLMLSSAAFLYYSLLFHSYQLLPKQVDAALGALAMEQIQGQEQFSFCEKERLQRFLEQETELLKPPESPFHYKVAIAEGETPNAFALPGGNIIVVSALLRSSQSPEEVVGILAHEMAHVELRHGLQQVIRSSGSLLLVSLLIGLGFEELGIAELLSEVVHLLLVSRYSRSFEAEADSYALQLLRERGISPRGLYQFFDRLDNSSGDEGQMGLFSYLDTHPAPQKRKEFFLQELRNWTISSEAQEKLQRDRLLSKRIWKGLKRQCP